MHGQDVGGRRVLRHVDASGGHERQVVEAADSRRGRGHRERQVPDPLEEEVAARLELEVKGAPDDRIHRDIGQPHRHRRAEHANTPPRVREAAETLDEVRLPIA